MSLAILRDRLSTALVVGLGAGASLLAAACIYDPDQRCDVNQHVGPNSSCACDDGLVMTGQTCVPCPESEVWQSGVCVCKQGFARDTSQGGACVESGANASCDLTAEPSTCSDPAFPNCRDHGAGVGYCTTTCAAEADCPHGFACDTKSDPATCKTAAVGQGDACTSNADCAGKDADYCEATITHVCLVTGCSVASPLSCSEGFSCCDVHSLGLALTLCVPEGACPTAK